MQYHVQRWKNVQHILQIYASVLFLDALESLESMLRIGIERVADKTG